MTTKPVRKRPFVKATEPTRSTGRGRSGGMLLGYARVSKSDD